MNILERLGLLSSEEKARKAEQEQLAQQERQTTIKKALGQKEDMSKDAIYMVGINEDGYTQLKVGYPTSVTLTLNPEAVALLIKQLGVTIDNDYNVIVRPYKLHGNIDE